MLEERELEVLMEVQLLLEVLQLEVLLLEVQLVEVLMVEMQLVAELLREVLQLVIREAHPRPATRCREAHPRPATRFSRSPSECGNSLFEKPPGYAAAKVFVSYV